MRTKWSFRRQDDAGAHVTDVIPYEKGFSGVSVGTSDCAGTATARAKTSPHLMQINYPLFGSRYLYVNRRGLIVCKIGCYVIEIV